MKRLDEIPSSFLLFFLFGCARTAAAVLLRSGNSSTGSDVQVASKQRSCSEGMRALKEKLREDHGFPIPSDGLHTWEVEGGADSGLSSYLGKLSADEVHHLGGDKVSATICETGFNYGTSAYSFLCSTEAKVFSWDIGSHDYVKPASELVDAEFPERHHLELGNSLETLKKAANTADRGPLRARRCDIVYVDGGHTQEVASADIDNFARLSRPGALLIVDDCFHGGHGHIQGVTTAFDLAVHAGKVEPLSALSKQFTEGRSICVGRFPDAHKHKSFLQARR